MDKLQLADGFLLLRPHERGDVGQRLAAIKESIVDVSQWMHWENPEYSTAKALKWIDDCSQKWDEGISYQFAIIDARDAAYLGGCGIDRIDADDRVGNLSYWVRSSRVRHGIASKAVNLLSRFGFQELKLNRIEILAATDNIASQRVAEKIGARREGILRNSLFLQGQAHDGVMFSLIPGDNP
jgi:ribosomal-protein-serine acetyltransferase